MKKVLAVFMMVFLVLGILSGCSAVSTQSAASNTSSKGDSSSSSGNKKLTIAVVPKVIGIPYFNASQTGAEKAGKDLGVNVIYTGPTQADAASQVKVIEDLISKKVDVIAVSANDAAALKPVLEKAKNAGIKVMDWDAPVDPSLVSLSVHQIDDEQYGRHIADLLVQKMGTDKGQYAIVTGGLSAANLNGWIKYAQQEIKDKYPGLTLATDKIGTDEKQQVAYQKTLDLLKAYPNLKGIMGFSTVAPLGVAQAVKEAGLQDKVAVVGTALPTDSLPFLKDGSLDAATLWDPGKLGYLTVYLAKQLAEGKMPTNGENVPTVGKIQVNPDGKTVIMGPPADFTKDNAANYKF
jgi:ABC-type sugar transport system substrate-binding protein